MPNDTDTMLTPDNHALLLIDHQSNQTISIKSHSTVEILNNLAIVGKAAKIFDIPTLVTTGFGAMQPIVEPLKSLVEGFPVIDRTTLNSWDDDGIRQWVADIGRPRLVIAGQWTEVCLSFPVLSALADGYQVYFVADASGGGSKETHDLAVQRMIQAGAVPLSAGVYITELQRDWARGETAGAVREVWQEHGGAFGQGLVWADHLTRDASA